MRNFENLKNQEDTFEVLSGIEFENLGLFDYAYIQKDSESGEFIIRAANGVKLGASHDRHIAEAIIFQNGLQNLELN